MEATHAESVYVCPECLTTFRGSELREVRNETPGKQSLRRFTPCCDQEPELAPAEETPRAAPDGNVYVKTTGWERLYTGPMEGA